MFRGTVPSPRKVIPTQDQEVCGGPRDEPAARSWTRKIPSREPLLFEGSRERAERSKSPRSLRLIDNTKCKFEPELQVVPARTEILIVNSDPVLHNTHGYLLTDSRRGRTVFN